MSRSDRIRSQKAVVRRQKPGSKGEEEINARGNREEKRKGRKGR